MSNTDEHELRRLLHEAEMEKQRIAEENEAMVRNMSSMRELLSEVVHTPVPDGLSPEELRQQLQSKLSVKANGTAQAAQGDLFQLLPPIADRDEASTEKALRAVAGVLGQSGKVVTAALKQAKGREEKLADIMMNIEQMLQREEETAEDASAKIRNYFKDLHEALTVREEEILKDFSSIRSKEKQRVEERLTELKQEDEKLSGACKGVEDLLAGNLSSSFSKLDSFNSPLEQLLEAMDSTSKVLEKDGRKYRPINGEGLETFTFQLCNDSSIYRLVESLQIVTYANPQRDSRGRIVGKGGQVVLMGTPTAVSDEAREHSLSPLDGSAVVPPESPHHGSSYSRSLADLETENQRWDLLEDGPGSKRGNGGYTSPPPPAEVGGAGRMKVVVNVPFHEESDAMDGTGTGLVHWLGTHGNQGEFKNPALFLANDPFLVVLRASSRIEGELASITGREHLSGSFFETDAALSSWVALELPERYWFRPDHYSMSYYVAGDEHIPRNWVLQGSPDGVRWTTLRVHENDTSLDEPPHVATWKVSNPSMYPDANDGKITPRSVGAYRFFRITQTGPNSSGTLFLIISSLEFYGVLYNSA